MRGENPFQGEKRKEKELTSGRATARKGQSLWRVGS